MITDLFNVINDNGKCTAALNICSIVKGKALSNFNSYPIIKHAFFTKLEGHYEMEDDVPGHNHHEGISEEGLLINFRGHQQLFIPETSKINMWKYDDNITFDIKDSYSSMHIQLQVLTNTQNTN